MKYDYIIIGGGASGLMLAAQVNTKGREGLILEGSARLGTKLLLSGGGHCNITHSGHMRDFIPAYGESGIMLRKTLYKHNNLALINFLEFNGIHTTTNEEGRIFPESMKALDVLNLLKKKVKENGWQVSMSSKVSAIRRVDDAWEISVVSSGNEALGDRATSSAGAARALLADKVIIASGGITFPETGSDGSMFKILGGDDLGLRVTPLKSALAPISVYDYPYAELSGVSIPDVVVTTFGYNKDGAQVKTGKISGDLLFTHSGFSGPVILNISAFAVEGGHIRINYNGLMSKLPKRMRKILEDRARGESGDIKTNKLMSLLENDDFIVREVSQRGMVTCGGIDLSEIDTSTMQLKKYPSIFVIGEALDIDGITGGYNLQACYSTASAVAEYINEELK